MSIFESWGLSCPAHTYKGYIKKFMYIYCTHRSPNPQNSFNRWFSPLKWNPRWFLRVQFTGRSSIHYWWSNRVCSRVGAASPMLGISEAAKAIRGCPQTDGRFIIACNPTATTTAILSSFASPEWSNQFWYRTARGNSWEQVLLGRRRSETVRVWCHDQDPL